MAPIFGTETGSVEIKTFNESKADAGAALGLKGLGDYRSLYVNNNAHANHRPKDPEHRTVEFMSFGKREAGELIPNPAYDEEEFKALPKQEQTSNQHVPAGWMADRAPAKARVSYDLPAAVIADVMKAR
eukprot:jgi/Astpho2/6779/Aster-07224